MTAPTLAETSDPAVLIPGSLTSLYDDAAALDAQAGELDDAAAQVRNCVAPSWLGSAAGRWTERRPELAARTAAPAEVYRAVAGLLRAHAGVIELARELVEIAIALWEQGVGTIAIADGECRAWGGGLVTDAWGGGLPAAWLTGEGTGPFAGGGAPSWMSPFGRSLRQQAALPSALVPSALVPSPPPPSPGENLCAQAERLLAELRALVQRSAAGAAALLDECSADMPDGRFHLGQVLVGIGDWVRSVADLTVRFSTPRLLLDGDAYLADAGGVVAGWGSLATELAENPHEFNRLLLDSETYRDDPGRWLGRLVPDAAFAVLGVPFAAERAGILGARAARILDDLAEARSVPAGAGVQIRAERVLADAARAEAHLSRLDHSPANDAMLARIRAAAIEGRPLHASEQAFLCHELIEAELMDAGMAYDEAHAIAGGSHPTFGNYHPDVVGDHGELFGTPWFEYWGLER